MRKRPVLLAQPLHFAVGDVEIGVDLLNIIGVFQGLHELEHGLCALALELYRRLGDHIDLTDLILHAVVIEDLLHGLEG